MATHDPLEFPLEWRGRVIVRAAAKNIEKRLGNALKGLGLDAEPVQGLTSRNGQYVTFRVTVTFEDRDMMEQATYALSQLDDVKMVL